MKRAGGIAFPAAERKIFLKKQGKCSHPGRQFLEIFSGNCKKSRKVQVLKNVWGKNSTAIK